MAAQALGLSRRQVYVLIRRARQGSEPRDGSGARPVRWR
ncbi:helix-turn-helix domain-containing protein [Escherichia coli]|nr:helix-turn-helix domain-containing protein [Escherichia coli]MCW3362255.1 helix-turn-helix domain-containing protein [Escherichia coli]